MNLIIKQVIPFRRAISGVKTIFAAKVEQSHNITWLEIHIIILKNP